MPFGSLLGVFDSDLRGDARVVEREGNVGLEALAAGQLLDLGQQEGRDVLAVHAGGVGGLEGDLMMPSM